MLYEHAGSKMDYQENFPHLVESQFCRLSIVNIHTVALQPVMGK